MKEFAHLQTSEKKRGPNGKRGPQEHRPQPGGHTKRKKAGAAMDAGKQIERTCKEIRA